MAKLQITKLTSGVRITDLETGAFEDVKVAADKADDQDATREDGTIVISTDEPELSGRLHYRA